MKYFLILLILVILVGFLFSFYCIYIPIDSQNTEQTIFSIKKGEGAKEISNNLEKQGFIRWNFLFRVYVLNKGISGNLKAGEYSLSKSMNIPEMVNKFISGEAIKKEITIIEGWNLRDIGKYFGDRGVLSEEELFELVGFPMVNYSKTVNLSEPKDFSKDFDFLEDKPKNLGLEGYLFPDTYQILSGDSIEEIVGKMLANLDKKLDQELKEEISRQKKTIFEIVIMASLIEKEVKTFEDKKIVSGILWKRLENNIPLQVDATITYITGGKTTKLLKEEIKIDSPYSTYKYKGLPLGPICNPGLESISAAIYPKDSEHWYYLSTPDGETIFNETLKGHNAAKVEYLR